MRPYARIAVHIEASSFPNVLLRSPEFGDVERCAANRRTSRRHLEASQLGCLSDPSLPGKITSATCNSVLSSRGASRSAANFANAASATFDFGAGSDLDRQRGACSRIRDYVSLIRAM